MLDYKGLISKTINLVKENKLLILLSLIISLSGILFFSNILSNYGYLINHKYFISFTNNGSDFGIILQSFLYNSIVANSGEALTSLSNIINGSYNTGIISINENNKTMLFSIFTFTISFIMFFIINIISTFITYTSKKQGILDIFKETKGVLKNVFILDFIKTVIITSVFTLIAFISITFSLNSYLFIILSFVISSLLFIVLYFIFQYALRYIIFFKYNIIESIKESNKLLFNNLLENLGNLLILISHIFLLFITFILLSLPVIFINYYFVKSGYLLFNDINYIFINLIILIILTISNLYIIKFLNELFGNLITSSKK